MVTQHEKVGNSYISA